MFTRVRWFWWLCFLCAMLLCLMYIKTVRSLVSVGDKFDALTLSVNKPKYVDRNGVALNSTYVNDWNIHTFNAIHTIPVFLQKAFVLSEDKRFYTHSGIDWLARANALTMNVSSGRSVRGASTLTEQVVRMLYPRPRSLWSRWLEGFEAAQLEKQYSKLDILEFYLNQVPYAANRRGVSQAAKFYFNRDLTTLNKKEMLALAVIVRSPKWYHPHRQKKKLNNAVVNLAQRMFDAGLLDIGELKWVRRSELELQQAAENFNTEHFLAHVKEQPIRADTNQANVRTTLDIEVQRFVQNMLDTRLNDLSRFNVNNGAVLVVDHEVGEIVAWVVGYAGKSNKMYNKIDPVVTPRQPGSTLKPFVYAKALDLGWTASTSIKDSPLEQSVGRGMHAYSNYSGEYYGSISLREALGNSLNIPAVKALQYVTTPHFLDFMYSLGVRSLAGHPNLYGDGIALGNGELTLYELVSGYSALARMGDVKALSVFEGQSDSVLPERVLNEDVASLIADILSDPAAREKEFGWDSILNFNVQTAVKTGTSSDYRDAWAVGFNDKYTIGIWMGNLDYSPMYGVTGSKGPALVLRSVFNGLNKGRQVKPLFFSQNLEKHSVCIDTGLFADGLCKARDEWFIPGRYPTELTLSAGQGVRFKKPSNNLQMAMDPRIPDASEVFEFELLADESVYKIDWYINDVLAASTSTLTYQWHLQKGEYVAYAKVWVRNRVSPLHTKKVAYTVF